MKKATFTLPDETLSALSEAVAHGAAPSKNALVQRALNRELTEWRRRMRRTRWEEAMADPLFVKDLHEIEEQFRSADAETLGDR